MRFPSLAKRGNLYYFQCRVPADLLRYFPRTQIRKSLKTENRKQALTMVKVLTAKTERLFFMARSQILTPKLMESLVQEYMDTLLDIDKEERYGIAKDKVDEVLMQRNNEFQEKYLMNPKKDYVMHEEDTGEQVVVSGAHHLAFHERLLADRCREQFRKHDYSEIAPIAAVLMRIEGVKVEQKSLEFNMFCDALLSKEAEAHEALASRAEKGFNNDYDKERGLRSIQRLKKLSDLIAMYERLNSAHIKKRGKKKLREHFSKILELTGNPYTQEINQNMLVDFFNDLAYYPTHRNHPHLQGLTLEECRNHPDSKPLALNTFKGTWAALGALLTFGSQNESYGITRNFCQDTVFRAMMKRLAQIKDSPVRRLPFIIKEVARLVVQLTKHRWQLNPHMLWIPLIGLLQGMRLEEICMLYLDDIVVVDGIDCFRIRNCQERHQSVKNFQSERIIPIHPTLLNLGFLDFIKSRRNQKLTTVWEGMKVNKIFYYELEDKYSHYFGKWFSRTLLPRVIPDEQERVGKCFHSTRHTFIGWFASNKKLNELDIAAWKGLVGHLEGDELTIINAAFQGVTWEVYSQKLSTQRLLDTLKQLDYGIDLSVLKLPMKW